ncbi:hypothetical protein ACFL45_04485 [Candidatus Neomarinimicrobiota bacterium]
MKKSMLVVILMAASTLSFAQQQTLVSGHVDHGGFGGPAFALTQITGETGILTGGHGGWIIDHVVYLGGGGYGLINEIPFGQSESGEEQFLSFNYGGLVLGGILGSDRLIHLTAHAMLGTGTVGYRYHDLDFENIDGASDLIYVLEPTVNVEMNVMKFFRIGAGASYRYVLGVDSEGLTDEDLSGLSAMLILKFGKF